MPRRLANLTLDTLGDLPRSCRGCVFWELGPAVGELVGDRALEKEAWLSRALLEWGSCGMLAYVDEAPVGYALYAPPAYLAGGYGFPTAPPSPDAVLLAALAVRPEQTGFGVGRMLVQAAAGYLARRGVRAIETYGVASVDLAGGGAGGAPGAALRAGAGCVAPAGFFTAVGFKTVRPHPRYPRLRMELRTALSVRAEVGQGVVQPGARRAARSSLTSIEPVATSASIG